MRIAMTVILLCWAALGSTASAAEKPVLTVYTYSSFTAEWGPGPAIKAAFETECDCLLDFIALDDGVTLLSRIRLEGSNSRADVVLGLDNNLIAEAAATDLFAPHDLDAAALATLALPLNWDDSLFVPFDYGYFAFVYNNTQLTDPPTSLDALVNGPVEQKILIQDPRTSTPGLGLLLWMRSVYGDGAIDAWETLNRRILTVSKGWSEAYGLFLEGEAPLVLSYTTSPAYHRIAENDSRFNAARFDEGHYLQIEVAGRLKAAPQPALAERFLRFMISENFQRHIPTGNWMFPVIELSDGLPDGFGTPLPAEQTLSFPAETIKKQRKQWINDWLDAVSQ